MGERPPCEVGLHTSAARPDRRSVARSGRTPGKGWLLLFVGLTFLVAAGCTDSGDRQQQGQAAAPAFNALFNKVLDYTLSQVPVHPDGDTVGDFGDSTAYGPAALLSLGKEEHRELALRIAGREAQLLDDPLWIINIVEVFIGTVGNYKAYEFTQEEAYRNTVEDVLDRFNEILDLALDLLIIIDAIPYGPTTIAGGIAMYNLQYGFSIGQTPRTDAYAAHGLDLIERIDAHAYDAENRYYWYAKFNDKCSSYPNAIMIIALCRAFQVTGDQAYLDRAMAVAETVEARLLVEPLGGYYGAQGSYDTYMALSNNNYLIQALLFLAEVSGETIYLERVHRTIGFVEQYLCEPGEGICYHDLRRGHRMDWFCSGCNWQILYNILEYRRVKAMLGG